MPVTIANGWAAKVQQQQEKYLDGCDYNRGVSKQTSIGLMTQSQDERVGREQQRPEKQRAFLSGPEHGKLVRGRQFAVAVVKDVCDRKVVVEGRVHQGDGGERYCSENGDSRAARRFAEAVGVLIRKGKCNQARDKTVRAQR